MWEAPLASAGPLVLACVSRKKASIQHNRGSLQLAFCWSSIAKLEGLRVPLVWVLKGNRKPKDVGSTSAMRL